jgi:hypothetical protein
MMPQKIKTFYFIKFESIIVCALTLTFSLQNGILYCHSLYRVDSLTKSWPTLMHLENEYIIFMNQYLWNHYFSNSMYGVIKYD